MLKKPLFVVEDTGTRKLLIFCVMLVFVFTADAVMSYWTPGFIQKNVGSATLMGLVMAFSSMVGLAMDFLFPQLMRNVGTKVLVALLLVSTWLFQGSMYVATFMPWVIIMLFGMSIWGIYYELMAFADQQFVAQTVNASKRATAWGIIGMVKGLAYLAGPLIAGFLEPYGDRVVLLSASSMSLCAVFLFMFSRMKNHEAELEHHEINLMAEFGHWKVLLKHVWPVITLSIMMGLVDAIFWTTGTVWAEKLSAGSPWGSFFLTAYMLPGLFVGLLVAKLGIVEHKKKISAALLIVANLALVGVAVSDVVWWQIMVVLVSSALGSFAFPLVNAVYTDIVSRMGRERKHLIGLSSSTFSLAYILGPIFGGVVSDRVGEQMTFAVVGLFAAGVCTVIYFVTPRKLKLPQLEIAQW